MGRKRTVEDFVESQYNNPGHRTGRGVGEGLADLARHRKPKDLRYPLFLIGMPLIVLGLIGLAVWVQSTQYNWLNVMFLLVLVILGLVFCLMGVAFRTSTRK